MDRIKNLTDIAKRKDAIRLLDEIQQSQSKWGKRRLSRFKTINGKRYQLHATRGWKAA